MADHAISGWWQFFRGFCLVSRVANRKPSGGANWRIVTRIAIEVYHCHWSEAGP